MIKKTLKEFFNDKYECEIRCNLIYCSESAKDFVSVISQDDIMYKKFKDDIFSLKSLTYDDSYDRYIIDLYLI